MYHLDIPKTRQYDNGKIEVVARSSVGEARTETTLTVRPRSDDYRGVLKNSPRRKYPESAKIGKVYRNSLAGCISYKVVFSSELHISFSYLLYKLLRIYTLNIN